MCEKESELRIQFTPGHVELIKVSMTVVYYLGDQYQHVHAN